MRAPQLRKNGVDGFPVLGLIIVGSPVPALSKVEPSATSQLLHRCVAGKVEGLVMAVG